MRDADREIVSAMACCKQDCERFDGHDTMKATTEDEPDNGRSLYRAWRRHADIVARAEPHRASKAEYGETS